MNQIYCTNVGGAICIFWGRFVAFYGIICSLWLELLVSICTIFVIFLRGQKSCIFAFVQCVTFHNFDLLICSEFKSANLIEVENCKEVIVQKDVEKN